MQQQLKQCDSLPIPVNLANSENSPVSLLNTDQFCDKASVSRAWLLDRMNKHSKNYDPSIPSRIWLSGIRGKGPVRFLNSAVEAWILSRAAIAQSALADQSHSVARGGAERGMQA